MYIYMTGVLISNVESFAAPLSPPSSSLLSCTSKVQESLPQLPSGNNRLYPKAEENVLYSATAKDIDSSYSPLGEPDLRDLPSFAYQISQGMVCRTNYDAYPCIMCIIYYIIL